VRISPISIGEIRHSLEIENLAIFVNPLLEKVFLGLIGIPKEKKERIFLRDESARASVRGLFIVREIIDINGITVHEAGETVKGTRFDMVVPKEVKPITE